MTNGFATLPPGTGELLSEPKMLSGKPMNTPPRELVTPPVPEGAILSPKGLAHQRRIRRMVQRSRRTPAASPLAFLKNLGRAQRARTGSAEPRHQLLTGDPDGLLE